MLIRFLQNRKAFLKGKACQCYSYLLDTRQKSGYAWRVI